jgi:hypothetical protein
MEPKATRRTRLGESSEASGTRGGVRILHAVERSRFSPKAKEGKSRQCSWCGFAEGEEAPAECRSS